MLQGLDFVIAHVPDVAAARAFYTEKLGFTVKDEQPGFVQFERPGGAGATFAISQGAPSASAAGEGTELWWFVQDADATHAALAARGVEIASPPKDEPFGRALAIKDVAGNTLYLLQVRQ